MQLHGTRDRVRITDGTWLRDIAKASRAEYDKSVQFALNRRRRLPAVARELIELAQSAREGDIRVPAGADRRAIGELIQNGAASVMQSSFPRSPISRSASSGVGPKIKRLAVGNAGLLHAAKDDRAVQRRWPLHSLCAT